MFNIVNFLSYVFISGITPGPSNLTSMSNATRLGFKNTIPYSLGLATGLFLISFICAIFGNLLDKVVPIIKLPMLIIGALYMLYLAFDIFISSFRKNDIKKADNSYKDIDKKQNDKNLFLSGILLQLVNVKVLIYIIVTMEVYVIPNYAGNYPMLLFFAIFMGAFEFFCSVCWSLFGTMFNTIFVRHAKVVNTVMALLLVYCAMSLFM